MAEKRKTWLVARCANWLASVPGTIDDWKGIAKRAGPGGAVATASLTPQARGAAMDNPGWAYWGFVALVMLVTIWSIVRYIDDQRQESQKEVDQARQEAERARQEADQRQRTARASEQARRMNRRTWSISSDERVSPEKAVEILLHEHVARVLVEEFIDRHPDACPAGDGKIELDRARLLAWLVRSSTQRQPSQKPLKSLEK